MFLVCVQRPVPISPSAVKTIQSLSLVRTILILSDIVLKSYPLGSESAIGAAKEAILRIVNSRGGRRGD